MMPDEMNMSEDAEETEAVPPIVHDDIMQRLLDYQRQLREGLTPEQAAQPAASPILVDYSALESPTPVAPQIEADEVIDLAAIEAAIEEPTDAEAKPAPADAVPQIWATSSMVPEPTPTPTTPAATDTSGDLAARLAKLEDTLSGVAESVSDLRAQFQDMAIAADDRLGAIESMISGAKDEAAAS
jgi:hypothetical protein